jgi:hypothetical protein
MPIHVGPPCCLGHIRSPAPEATPRRLGDD